MEKCAYNYHFLFLIFFFFLWIYFAHFLIFGKYSQFNLPSNESFLHSFNKVTQVENHIFICVQRVGGQNVLLP